MSESRRTVRRIASLAALAGILAGCSGSGSTAPAASTPPPSSSPPPAPIVGIATPTTVSVVTATNAN